MLLRLEAGVLVALAVALAGPVPAYLARARWPARAPRAALVLWQAVGLGGGLGVLTGGLTLAAGDLGHHWLTGLGDVPGSWDQLGIWGWIGVGLFVGMGGWFVFSAAASVLRVVAARSIQRIRLDAVADVGRVGAARPGVGMVDIRLVDHPAAFAYCLPGLRPRVVLSEGAIRTLPDRQLAAVLAHEEAHARGHHDLVIQPFVAWSKTFPFLAPASAGLDAVGLLVEMLADDAALRQCAPENLAAALRRLGEVARSGGSPGCSPLDRQLASRLARMGTPRPLARRWRGAIYLAAFVLVVLPPVVLVVS